MLNQISFLIGVDGGGTGTRVAIANQDGVELARANAGPSGLINGAEVAWNAILSALNEAFISIHQTTPALSQMAIGLGLAGAHNKQWAANFVNCNPGFALMQCETDAHTTLLGAHQGMPGAIIALGTGSVGEALYADGSRHEVGGWGFPCGDEASGAWLGLQAVNHIQQVMDKRAEHSPFSDTIIACCGGHRDAIFDWLATANQQSYAQLVPFILLHETNSVVKNMLQKAGLEITKIALALDQTGTLSIALCGSLAKPLEKYIPAALLQRLVPASEDSVAGALLLIKNRIKKTTAQP